MKNGTTTRGKMKVGKEYQKKKSLKKKGNVEGESAISLKGDLIPLSR